MPAPLFKVEVAFANGPNDAAPTYTDITSFVRMVPPLTYSRGNTDETQQLQAGQMSFTVDNTDGRFTVGSSASTSAWGTVLKIRRPVRLSIWNGSSYVVAWTGTVDDWGATWLEGTKGLSRVTCSDRVASAGRIELPPALLGEMLFDDPVALYPLTETAGSSVAADVSRFNRIPLEKVQEGRATVSLGIAPPTPLDPDGSTCAQFNYSTTGGAWLAALGPDLVAAPGRTFEAWFYVGTFPTGLLSGGVYSLGASYISVSDEFNRLEVNSSVGTPIAYRSFQRNAWNHVAVVDSISGGNITTTVYVNGVASVSGSVAGTSITDTGNVLFVGFYWPGYISHVGVYGTALSAARITDRYNAVNGWTGELTGARWNRLCRIAGLSSTWYTADTGSVPVGTQATSGQTLAAALQTVAVAEQGSAYASTSGVLTLKAASNRYNKTSTLTIAPQSVGRDLTFVANDSYLVNESLVLSANNQGGLSKDTTSQTDNGPYREQLSTVLANDWAALNLSQYRIRRYKTPTARARGLSINGTTKAASITATQLLALDVDSRITLSPLTGPAPASSVQVFIDGLSGSIGSEWEVTFNTSPTTGLDGLVLDTSTLDNAASILLY